MNDYQIERVAKTTAELIHYSLCWEEPFNMDYIDCFVNALKQELMELNGEN